MPGLTKTLYNLKCDRCGSNYAGHVETVCGCGGIARIQRAATLPDYNPVGVAPALPPKTLRDEFAMAVLPGIVKEGIEYSLTAHVAYKFADAMLSAREKK